MENTTLNNANKELLREPGGYACCVEMVSLNNGLSPILGSGQMERWNTLRHDDYVACGYKAIFLDDFFWI